MTPKAAFDAVWQRYDALFAIHAYLSGNAAAVLDKDELLRAEWVGRVSALDLFVHELVAQLMLEEFRGTRSASRAFLKFRVQVGVVDRIRNAPSPSDAEAAFDLEVRSQIGLLTFQHPDKIADGIRLVSDLELWNEFALAKGAAPANKADVAKAHRGSLAAIVDRRNKIAHEGDFGPTIPRTLNTISANDLTEVRNVILATVDGIGAILS